jgi:hypothetical protein
MGCIGNVEVIAVRRIWSMVRAASAEYAKDDGWAVEDRARGLLDVPEAFCIWLGRV